MKFFLSSTINVNDRKTREHKVLYLNSFSFDGKSDRIPFTMVQYVYAIQYVYFKYQKIVMGKVGTGQQFEGGAVALRPPVPTLCFRDMSPRYCYWRSAAATESRHAVTYCVWRPTTYYFRVNTHRRRPHLKALDNI